MGLAVDGLLNRYLLLALQNLPPSTKTVDKVAAVSVYVVVFRWRSGWLGLRGMSSVVCVFALISLLAINGVSVCASLHVWMLSARED